MISREVWLDTVLRFVGTPYHHQGRQPGLAMDCPAPLICAAWETGIKPRAFDVSGYPRNADGKVLKALCDEHFDPIDYSEAVPGDVILAAWAREKMKPRHLGVLTEKGERAYWLQAEGYRHKKVIVTRLMFGVDGMYLVQAYRVPGVACS